MSLTVRALRAACAPLESALEDLGAVSEDALATMRPRGRQPAGSRAWLHYYGELRVLHARATAGDAQAAGSGSLGPDSLASELALEQCIAAEPRPVLLSDGTTVHVYPKGLHALRWLDSLDRQLVDAFSLAASTVSEVSVGAPLALMPLVEAYATRVWAWVLTHEGAEIPFDESAAMVDPPEWTTRMTERDVIGLAREHIEVHGERLRLVAALYPADPTSGGSRLSLAGFIGVLSQEMGVRPRDLMRRWSLGELFGQAVSTARAHKLALDRAEAERRGGGGEA